MKNLQQVKLVEVRKVAVLTFVLVAFLGFLYSQFAEKSSGSNDLGNSSSLELYGAGFKNVKFSEFPHSKHKQNCSSCHKFPSPNWKTVRNGNEAFPDVTEYPRHESCLSCHRKQFYNSPTPVICTICHTNPSPRNGTRHPFPNPREIFDLSPKGKTAVSDFAISFPHDKHIEFVSDGRGPSNAAPVNSGVFVKAGFKSTTEESCVVCHQTYKPQGETDAEYVTAPPKDLGDEFWLKKGTFKTAPTGHTTCFTCHSTDIGILPAPTDCAVCHKPKPPEVDTDFDFKTALTMKLDDKILMNAWRNRDSSATFRHELSSHSDLECANCHNVQAIETLKPATKKVDIMSCSMCHITATSDDGGILNYEIDERKKNGTFNCTKCHITFGKSAVPETHFKAVAAQ